MVDADAAGKELLHLPARHLCIEEYGKFHTVPDISRSLLELRHHCNA